MRKIILLTFLLLNSLLFCQELTYEEVIPVDSSVTKEELYNRARTWFAKSFKDEGEVLTIQDKDTGEISGNGSFRYRTKKMFFGLWCIVGNIHFKINIYLKDGKYKYTIHSLTHEGSYFDGNRPISYGLLTVDENAPQPSRGGANDKVWRDIKVKSDEKIVAIISDLRQAMTKNHETSNDW
ncbi:DUF4468 domain-containing protein [Chryseobacterium sp. JK1]|uniref:DUF4468 domain-containing protein n=1 Tax=Chryseobacterium sp. JK1 TaxID=874294 RepID=UPI003D6998A0